MSTPSCESATSKHNAERSGIYFELTKPRITLMVLLTVAAGFFLAGGSSFGVLVHTLVGAGLSCIGSGALNQYYERESDGLMHRTRFRPLPAQNIAPGTVLLFGVLTAGGGVAWHAALVGTAVAMVNAVTVCSYVFIYTPLKHHTHIATLVGAIPGALPPVIGWTAVRGQIDAGAWILFAILFLWQIPHFLAIGRMYREDYAAAGIPMLSVVEPDGRVDGAQMTLYAAALLPVSLLLLPLGLAGKVYFWSAIVAGTGYLVVAIQTAPSPGAVQARKLLLASVLYLPIVSAAIVIDGFLR